MTIVIIKDGIEIASSSCHAHSTILLPYQELSLYEFYFIKMKLKLAFLAISIQNCETYLAIGEHKYEFSKIEN